MLAFFLMGFMLSYELRNNEIQDIHKFYQAQSGESYSNCVRFINDQKQEWEEEHGLNGTINKRFITNLQSE